MTPYQAQPRAPAPGLSSYTRPPAVPPYNDDDRSRTMALSRFSAQLPRYSTIDFSEPSLEQIDHWNEADTDSVANGGAVINANAESTPTNSDFPQPPRYSPGQIITRSHPPHRPHFILHKFHIEGKGKATKPWATLKLISRSPVPGSKSKTPRFIGGDSLRGTVDINLDKPMSIHSIEVKLKGRVQLNQEIANIPSLETREHVFLDEACIIFSRKTSGDPRWTGQCEKSKNRPHDGLMHGSYSFPFNVAFPTSLTWDGQTGRDVHKVYNTPPSFRERHACSAVVYEAGLLIVHGKLRSKNKVTTDVIFVPKLVPPPASERRQTAYLEGALIPGPNTDPEGWQAVSPVTVHGQFQDRIVEVTCTLSLAKPLSYTRGTVIPCHLNLSSLDFRLLDVLATPNTINLRLSRYLRNPSLEREQNATSSPPPLHIASCVWWRPAKLDVPAGPRERQLEGEIHLAKSLVPSCDSPLFTAEYMVELMPFSLEGLTMICSREKSARNNDRPILEKLVNISTFHEHGPIPIPFTTKSGAQENNNRKRDSGRYLEEIPTWMTGISLEMRPQT